MRKLGLVSLVAMAAGALGCAVSAGEEADAAAAAQEQAQELQPEAVPVVILTGGDREVRVNQEPYGPGVVQPIERGMMQEGPEGFPGYAVIGVDTLLVGVEHGFAGDLPEGQLIRFDVIAPAGEEETLCLGFYSNMAEAAVANTYRCIKCNGIWVCGVNPRCWPQE